MWKLAWLVATVTAQGPQIGNVPESTRFPTETTCTEFGKAMSSRLADWVRGSLRAEWSIPVAVHFECELDGNPA